jgi:uncharacterized protein
MKHGALLRMVGLLTVTSLLVLAGCVRTQPARFYLLSPLPGAERMGEGQKATSHLMLTVGPVKLPQYLDRPQIVTRHTSNRLELAELDRWGEPLEDTFARVLAEDLSVLLATDKITIFPRTEVAKTDYQVIVEVIRFEGEPGGAASLHACWSIAAAGGEERILTRKSVREMATQSEGYEGLVAAQSALLGELSREIADAIGALPQKTP